MLPSNQRKKNHENIIYYTFQKIKLWLVRNQDHRPHKKIFSVFKENNLPKKKKKTSKGPTHIIFLDFHLY